MTCTLTCADHMATWTSWRDDCTGEDGCGFGMQDLDQCDRGHPDDEATFCGACGHDKVYNALQIGELSAICDKADALGANTDGWSIAQIIRAFPLTDDERKAVRRRQEDAGRRARTRWTPEQRARFTTRTGLQA